MGMFYATYTLLKQALQHLVAAKDMQHLAEKRHSQLFLEQI